MSKEEECSSNESGWTMYIGSPYRDYNHGEDDDDDEGTPRTGYKNLDYIEEGGGSDDSMTSDASSGPSQQGVITSTEQRYGKHELKHAEKDNRKFTSKEQHRQAKKKLIDKNVKAAKEDPGHKAKSGKSYGYFKSN